MAEAGARATAAAGPRPPTARERADRFYESKMASVFRRARTLLHPRGRMVMMFNHKQTWAWRSLGMALIRAGFEVRSSVPIHTEAESSLNIRGLDAARSTVLLLCERREEAEQPVGNWVTVQNQVRRVARGAAERFQKQGLEGTDLYLSSLGPALGVVGRNWPVTDFAGREIDLTDALEAAYRSVGQFRLGQILAEITALAGDGVADGFSAEGVDRSTQTLWLWLDTFQGEVAGSDDVRKLAKALDVDPSAFQQVGLLRVEKDTFILASPQEVDLARVARRLAGAEPLRGRVAREDDLWSQRRFPNFLGAATWNAVALVAGGPGLDARGPEALRRWLSESGYGAQREFRSAFAVTLSLMERAFKDRDAEAGDAWGQTRVAARRAWDLVIRDLRA